MQITQEKKLCARVRPPPLLSDCSLRITFDHNQFLSSGSVAQLESTMNFDHNPDTDHNDQNRSLHVPQTRQLILHIVKLG